MNKSRVAHAQRSVLETKLPHVLSMLNARESLDPSNTLREVNHAQILAAYTLSTTLAPKRVGTSSRWHTQAHPQSSWSRSPTSPVYRHALLRRGAPERRAPDGVNR